MITRALILAAGRGIKVGEHPGPNSLTPVGRCTLIERALQVLDSVGIQKVGIVVGWKAAELRKRVAASTELRPSQKRDIVVFVRRPDWSWYAGFLYATWSHYSHRPPPACLFLDGDASQELIEQLQQAPTIWLISQREPDGGVGRIQGLNGLESKSFLFAADVLRCQFTPPTTRP